MGSSFHCNLANFFKFLLGGRKTAVPLCLFSEVFGLHTMG